MSLVRVAIGWAIVKGVTIATATGFIIGRADLTLTERSLLVAFVSGLLGIIGVVLGAKISSGSNKEVLAKAVENHELAERNEELLHEIQALTEKTKAKVDVIEPRSQLRQVPDPEPPK